MVGIKLREDGWFEAGKDAEKTIPIAYLIYKSKQELKKCLEDIGEQKDIGALEKALKDVPELFQFRRTPYIVGNRIMIDTPGLPGQCYLGDITK
jgi:hypothetical protein